ncbi:HAMP domain-containing protein [Myxococcota bacterium]|nr:HAMP domain-containing protein [Myxococcota bacterium]MBU1898649.1 HAMP domain-containing protein [Myxococcota bacterium]
MKRSFVRLVVSSVLACWAVGVVVVVWYSLGRSWADDHARGHGVFLAHELLDAVPAPDRADRLATLRQHFSIDLTLLSVEDVERRLGRSVGPGEQIPHRVRVREEWYFLAFEDGQGALVAGPVDPTVPRGFLPVGVFLAMVGLPALAGLLALRIGRQIGKVEQASRALAVGQFDTRVDNPHGPTSELAASFNAMAERVERLIRSRDELVQAVSHELGSPLSRLRFHMELLGSGSDAQREERLGRMARELDALDELVAELLSYVQSDELELELHAFDPQRVLADLAELARLEVPDDATIEVDVELPESIRVLADQRLFQRAVENLLRNAVQHARSKVLLELASDGDQIRVTVHDDGPGIPEQLREKVTAPFFRLEAERGRRTGGLGLGLAIVSGIVLRHGGRLVIGRSPCGGAAVETVWQRPG